VNRREDFARAKTRRERGIVSSILHADQASKDWPDRAFVYLVRYATAKRDPFTVEQFRLWAHEEGLEQPPDRRAFGGVTLRALHRGVLSRVGYQPTASSNGSAKPLYRGNRARVS